MQRYKKFLGLGIVGNFALHLEQAGELEEFKDIITVDETAPKGMFPFYIPKQNIQTSSRYPKKILFTNPLSSQYIQLPKENVNIQAEPEVGLVCELEYTAGKLSKITPTHFGAYNDCSIRIAGARKISEKKNWGENSKGFSQDLIAINAFKDGGVMDNYSITSFLVRNSEFHHYGEDVTLKGYSYFHEKLLNWMLVQINKQEDVGPLESLQDYIIASDYPTQAIISIGATRYTKFGEKTFLKLHDEMLVIVYNNMKISSENLLEAIKTKTYDKSFMSVLSQKVI